MAMEMWHSEQGEMWHSEGKCGKEMEMWHSKGNMAEGIICIIFYLSTVFFQEVPPLT